MPLKPRDVHARIDDQPLKRIYAELWCLFWAMVPHEGNHKARTLGTLAVVLVWGSIEVGAAFDYATLPNQFFFLRLVVGVIIGRMWGVEINNFAGVEFAYGDGSDSDGDE
jgi:hypothetical protein